MYDDKHNSSTSLEKGLGVETSANEKASIDKGLGVEATTHAAGEYALLSLVASTLITCTLACYFLLPNVLQSRHRRALPLRRSRPRPGAASAKTAPCTNVRFNLHFNLRYY